jgi:hypothetical protein
MTSTNQADVRDRLKQSWSTFQQKATPEQIAKVKDALQNHSDSLIYASVAHEAKPSEFSLAKSVLEDTLEEDMAKLLPRFYTDINSLEHLEGELGIELSVLKDGEILGTGKYEALDIDWLEAVITWLDHYFDDKRAFPQPGTWVTIPGNTTLAIFGDWGGGVWDGNSVAQSISDIIGKLKVDYSIHLGDVYYAGEPQQETDNLLKLWPAGAKGNFTLNSNHEMYPLGKGYFDTSLPDSIFNQQAQKSFFALENDNWIIAGLDSAFDADKDDLYLVGGINPQQTEFLTEIGKKGKPVIVLCHHNPLDITGSEQQALWDQVAAPLNGNLKYWYWGHIHAAAAYKPHKGVYGRVVGHGVIPWGNATSLQDSATVEWYEHEKPVPADGVRVQNGFMLVSLKGDQLTEEFYGEDGTVHWTPN